MSIAQDATKTVPAAAHGRVPAAAHGRTLEKARSGIQGLDEITGGGLPRGRPTLICGTAGCGKTLFGMEFILHGAIEMGEPGVFVTFEETPDDLVKNVASLGFDLREMVERRLVAVDHVRVERQEIEETGEYDLDGLFIRLGYAIDSIGAKRVVLDTIESLFGALPNEAILRAELRRLFGWLKDRGITAIITAERGEGELTRQGLEEYVSDCVILLDQRVRDQITTRRLRIVKYRGSAHGSNEYPFLIEQHGISVLPITSAGLAHQVSEERISTGVPRLDAMLGGRGIYRGSSVLVSGTAGSGKSSLAMHAVAAACRRGETAVYFSFEESQDQVVRNMRSIGIDLAPFLSSGLLRFRAERPTLLGLEAHLAAIHREIEQLAPALVVIDPITTFLSVGTEHDVRSMLLRVLDFLKSRGTTAIFTSLTSGGAALEHTETEVSSLIDTWLLVRFVEGNGERNRALYVLKSRGMAHSNQVRELVMTSEGIDLADVYAGSSGVLTGAARRVQEAKEREEAHGRRLELERKRREATRRMGLLEAQISALHSELELQQDELTELARQEEERERELTQVRDEMIRMRGADSLPEPLAATPEATREGKAA
jgi:circadian clock protein KaiC